jgi:hypothetical protein
VMAGDSMKSQRGGFVMGLIIGLLAGLAWPWASRLYVTKVPVPFVNKVPQRTAEDDAAERRRTRTGTRTRRCTARTRCAAQRPRPARLGACGSRRLRWPSRHRQPVTPPPIAAGRRRHATRPRSWASARRRLSPRHLRPPCPTDRRLIRSPTWCRQVPMPGPEDAEQQRASSR